MMRGMSIRALCLGVEKRLRDALGDPSGTWIGYQPDGKPPHAMGQKYLAVYFGGYQTASKDPTCDDRRLNVAIAATFKFGYAPGDRRGAEAAKEGVEHFLDLVDQVPGYLIPYDPTMNLANGFIEGFDEDTNGFVEGFDAVSCGNIEEKSAEWVGAHGQANPPTVLAMTITARGARRIRLLGTVA